jgi:hypothetical protein
MDIGSSARAACCRRVRSLSQCVPPSIELSSSLLSLRKLSSNHYLIGCVITLGNWTIIRGSGLPVNWLKRRVVSGDSILSSSFLLSRFAGFIASLRVTLVVWIRSRNSLFSLTMKFALEGDPVNLTAFFLDPLVTSCVDLGRSLMQFPVHKTIVFPTSDRYTYHVQ